MILDTNVWLDWLVFDDPGVRRLRTAIADGELRPLACARMRDELISVLARPLLLARRADAPAQIVHFDERVQLLATPPGCRLACTDTADQVFIDLAVHHRARWLLTKDRALLRLARRARRDHAIAVLTPRDFDAAYNPPSPDELPPR